MSSTAWRAPPGCPRHLISALERAVNAHPPAYLLAPVSGEVFASPEEGESRLAAYSLSHGFDIVKTGTGAKLFPSHHFTCVFHGQETRNYRRLEEHVEKDADGVVITQRKRDLTVVRQSGCEWSVRVSLKTVGPRGSGHKAWTLSVKSLEHVGHKAVENPLSFPRHKARLDEFQRALAQSRLHRISIIPYSVSRRVLESEEFGVNLSTREYYNSVRSRPVSSDDEKSIQGLVAALKEAGFIYRLRVQDEIDSTGKPLWRKLIQIWFTHPRLLDACKRFVADALITIDATFNTNALRMPILVAVGVLNNNQTFPVAFSYCPSESHESYVFFWDSLKEHCFINASGQPPIASPRVVLADQALAISSSVAECFPDAQMQICDWHAVQAMLAKFRSMGHRNVEIDGGLNAQGEPQVGLKDLAWNYVRSMTPEVLETNRSVLASAILEPPYINNV